MAIDDYNACTCFYAHLLFHCKISFLTLVILQRNSVIATKSKVSGENACEEQTISRKQNLEISCDSHSVWCYESHIRVVIWFLFGTPE